MKTKTASFYLSAVGLIILTAAIGWRTVETKAPASSHSKIVAPMPNLNGEEAEAYLAENNLRESLGEAIKKARYSVNRSENYRSGAFEARNPNHNFAAYFTGDGVDLVSRGKEENWNLSLRFKSFGFGAVHEEVAVGNQRWAAAQTKISTAHETQSQISNFKFRIDEVFENKPEGLEQSFIVDKISDFRLQPPDPENVKIVLNIRGDLQPKISDDGQALIFSKDGADVLRYDKLRSWDARGAELPSVMELDGGELSLVVDAKNAVYPVTIDPTFTQVKKLVGSDSAAQDAFGFSVAVSGNTAVVGAVGHNSSNAFQGGAAYIFERNAGGANNWTQVKKLTPADLTNYDYFGTSVAVEGDTVIVGAPDTTADFGGLTGAIYVFERNQGGANNWGQVKKRTPSDGQIQDAFGFSVSLSGGTLIVGAPQEINAETPAGAAYIFERNAGGANNWGEVKIIEAIEPTPSSNFGFRVDISGDTAIIAVYAGDAAYIVERDSGGADNWGEVKKLTASDGAGGAFGYSAAIDGDRAVVGAYIRTIGGNSFQGAAYVFERNKGGANDWGEVKRLVASDGAAFDNFGSSVALSGDKIVVGAYEDDTGTISNQGSAYVFERNAGSADNWGQVNKLTASDGIANDLFGWAVAVEGTTLLIGARASGVDANNGRGAAYVFVRANETWTQQTKSLPASCTVEDYFGGSVAIFGDTAIVGAPADDVGSNANQGAAYIFERNAGGANNWGLVKTISAADGAANDRFGNAVAIAGETIIVGAFQQDAGTNPNQGAAYLFERNAGGANNWGQVKKLTAADGAAEDWFGHSVAVSGNTAIVGAILDDVGASSAQGSAYIYERNQGGANNWGEVKHLIASDGASGDTFGKSVAVSGETAIIGADGDSVGGIRQGSVYIVERNIGGANNWGELRKINASDGASNDGFGVSAAVADDTIIVGAWQDDVNNNNAQGAAYIFERNTGGANNWGQVKKLLAADGASGDSFGFSVAVAGDAAIVGSFNDQIGANAFQGSAYIFRQNAGGANNWGQVKKLAAADGATQDNFGRSVAISGDTAIAGAPSDDVGGAFGQGSASIFVSGGDVWSQQANISPPPPGNCGASDYYGFSVAVSGDTAVVGAPADDVGINGNQGSVYILERNQGGANNWGVVKLLTASDGAANDNFGLTVALSGGTVIVGAGGVPNSATSAGAAYLFERNAGGTNNFGEVKKLTAGDGAPGDRFGFAVAVNGSTAVVGATRDNNSQGAAYVFERGAGGVNNWGETKKLVDSGGAADEFFGWSVFVQNDTIFVSSPGATVGTNPSQGAVHIFERHAGGANFWARTKYLTAADGAFGDNFGWAVAASGNLLIVSATGDGVGEFTGEGAAYIFERDGGGTDNWGQVKKIRALDGGQQDQFGSSVGLSGGAAIVGAPYDDVGGNENQGSAYIFEQNAGGADNWGQVAKLTAADGATGDLFGYSVAASGDDFFAGAYLANAPDSLNQNRSDKLLGGNTRGAGYVFRGRELSPTAANVSISGRVLTTTGGGISKAQVVLTNASGVSRTAVTNSFGWFRFDEVPAGATYVIEVRHKKYRFAPRVLAVIEDISELILTAENE